MDSLIFVSRAIRWTFATRLRRRCGSRDVAPACAASLTHLSYTKKAGSFAFGRKFEAPSTARWLLPEGYGALGCGEPPPICIADRRPNQQAAPDALKRVPSEEDSCF